MHKGAGRDIERLYGDLRKTLHFSGESPNVDFYVSSLIERNPLNATDEILQWLRELNSRQYFNVEQIPLGDMKGWTFNPATGDLEHESGGFFSVRGLQVATNTGPISRWTQPIIDQPEIGVLGIVTKKIDGIPYFLMQAKAEPGNINTFQVSPTVQATRSNYMRLHGGKPTRYLEYFLDSSRATVLIDQLQSEQGARFYRKRNRNIIVRVADDEDIELDGNFRWMTLGQIKTLMRTDNTVNMDARSVIANISYDPAVRTSLDPVREDQLRDCLTRCSPVSNGADDFGIKAMVSAHGSAVSVHTDDDLLRQVSRDKFECELDSQVVPLSQVQDWRVTDEEICHQEGKYFSVIGVRISAANREVLAWDQPIVKQIDAGIVGNIAREIDGTLHFLVQLKTESGNIDLLELAPTVQCITGSYEDKEPPFVGEMLEPSRCRVIFDTLQSEEGGRFYHEENRNVLLLNKPDLAIEERPRYHWMSMRQLKLFLKFGNLLNVESRSLLAIT